MWHVPPGQWWITICHDSADAGRAPCSGSVAEPEYAMTSPTLYFSDADGAAMVAVGA